MTWVDWGDITNAEAPEHDGLYADCYDELARWGQPTDEELIDLEFDALVDRIDRVVDRHPGSVVIVYQGTYTSRSGFSHCSAIRAHPDVGAEELHWRYERMRWFLREESSIAEDFNDRLPDAHRFCYGVPDLDSLYDGISAVIENEYDVAVLMSVPRLAFVSAELEDGFGSVARSLDKDLEWYAARLLDCFVLPDWGQVNHEPL